MGNVSNTVQLVILERMEKKLDQLLDRVAALENTIEGRGDPHQ